MPRKIKFTRQQAGAIGGRSGTGKSKRRGSSAYYSGLKAGKKKVRATPATAPAEAPAEKPRVVEPPAPDPLAALPRESETERRMRLDLPVLQVSNPVAPVAPPPGFTHRPHYQS